MVQTCAKMLNLDELDEKDAETFSIYIKKTCIKRSPLEVKAIMWQRLVQKAKFSTLFTIYCSQQQQQRGI